ncbi:putative signal transduction protein [uncultured Pleomorphomonas sp.]|uniref:Putative signal transduction protein n=1 Tax=uncultured Pleomorphomonas sp. TaxID=442121 RepID=A0A212LJB3_9HYPH|nr:sensor domain-containing phosphodiesterase [uncultured Pleomorphomonas sp.]SCM77632.1 putative signal transduction protein [uncultured Pleomorphomonas sp.]
MKCPPVLPTEVERLKALSEYGLGDERPLPSLDSVVRIAARMFDMPVAAVNMIGSDHVFFAASTGVGEVDMSRDVSFCAHAITQDSVMVVPDATTDERFHDNPLVTGSAGLRFYAGVPLLSANGLPLGALCVIDHKPHEDFSQDDRSRLRELANMAADRLELRRIEVSAERAVRLDVPQDVAACQDEAKELYRLANFDILTGLANRGRFFRQVEEALARPLPVAAVMIDLESFKDVNDTLGHAVGDYILQEVAHRLETSVRDTGIAARIGGDEFAILLYDVTDPQRASEISNAVNDAIARPIIIDDQEIRIAASCGVALAPLHTGNPVELLGNADLALFRAKTNRRGRSLVFEPSLRMEAAARRLYGMEIHRAVKEGEFLLVYQPQIRLSDGALTGAEALIRWRHPIRGLLTPAAFLPALERGPLAATVGSWVLDEACAQAALWRRNGMETFRMGVNLFAAQLRGSDFATEVIDTLEKHGLPPSSLELEITENIVLDHDDVVLEKLRDLRAYGIGIAFDDFGTGYASLSLLKRYPLTRIKIDRSFVDGMLVSEKDASVVRAILDIARAFDLETIAEGIEREPQRDGLLHQGCTEGQGYLIGKPMLAPHFAEAFDIAPPLPMKRAVMTG